MCVIIVFYLYVVYNLCILKQCFENALYFLLTSHAAMKHRNKKEFFFEKKSLLTFQTQLKLNRLKKQRKIAEYNERSSSIK